MIVGYGVPLFTFNILITGNGEKYLIGKYLKNKEKVEAVALGTSHVWDLNFDSIGLNGIGFGMGGRDLNECNYILEYLLSQKNNNIKWLFLSISYFTLYQDNNLVENGFSDVRSYMYNTIPSNKILDNDLKNFMMGKFLPFIQSDHWRFIVAAKFKQFKQAFYSKTAVASTSKPSNQQKEFSIETVKARVQQQIAIHDRAIKNEKYNTKEYNLKVLRKILETAMKNNIEVILFTPPYYYKYTELYPNVYIEEVKYEVKKLVDNFKVLYIDFSTDLDL